MLKDDPTLYLDEIAEHLKTQTGLQISISPLAIEIRDHLVLTRKAARTVHPNQSPIRRGEYVYEVGGIQPECLVFLVYQSSNSINSIAILQRSPVLQSQKESHILRLSKWIKAKHFQSVSLSISIDSATRIDDHPNHPTNLLQLTYGPSDPSSLRSHLLQTISLLINQTQKDVLRKLSPLLLKLDDYVISYHLKYKSQVGPSPLIIQLTSPNHQTVTLKVTDTLPTHLISVIYTGLEVFVIVPASQRSEQSMIGCVLEVGRKMNEQISWNKKKLALNCLIFPTLIPMNLRASIRFYYDLEQLNCGFLPDKMNLLSLDEVFEGLEKVYSMSFLEGL
ncbi:hypothetical protein DFH28DRAFT_1125970 [Melampsora americana]|nr:hypothetical protein DFH28DRAFT_1125970 [Melampsora americana]